MSDQLVDEFMALAERKPLAVLTAVMEILKQVQDERDRARDFAAALEAELAWGGIENWVRVMTVDADAALGEPIGGGYRIVINVDPTGVVINSEIRCLPRRVARPAQQPSTDALLGSLTGIDPDEGD